MNPSRLALLLAAFSSLLATAQTQTPPDPYKPVLDRLQAITTIPLKDWASLPAAMAHCEDASASGGPSSPVAINADLSLPACLRSKIEIPKQSSGYSLDGARLILDLNIDSNQEINVSGVRKRKHDRPHRRRRPSPHRAHPTRPTRPDVRVLGPRVGDRRCWMLRRQASSKGQSRASCWSLPQTASPTPASFARKSWPPNSSSPPTPTAKQQRQQQLDAAVKAIDLGALDKGDQAGVRRLAQGARRRSSMPSSPT